MTDRLSRRRFLTVSGAAAGGLVLGPAVLAACGGGSDNGSASGGPDVYFDNWTLYIDKPGGKLYGAGGTLDRFQKASGRTIKYVEGYNDNNEYFAKVQPILAAGRTIAPNLIAPTFWMAGRYITLGWAEKLPLAKVPNAKNLIAPLQKPPSDPTGEFSLPWQSGMAGIAYNQKVTGRPLTKVEDLWDPAFKGKIGLLTEMRDTVGLVAMSKGIELADPSFAKFQPAFDVLQEQVDKGQIRAFTGNDYTKDLVQGNYAACVGWSGDVVQLAKSNPDIKFVIPDSGGTLWFDTMVVPKGAKNTDAVAQFMDFVYDPANAARITAEVQYISPVDGVRDELRKIGGDAAALADSQLLFPDDATRAKLQSWGNLDEAEEKKFDDAFAKISGT